MGRRIETLRTKASAVGGLLRISESEFKAFMGTYNKLFQDSPENTLEDYENSIGMAGYTHGSSEELAQYYKLIHLMSQFGLQEIE